MRALIAGRAEMRSDVAVSLRVSRRRVEWLAALRGLNSRESARMGGTTIERKTARIERKTPTTARQEEAAEDVRKKECRGLVAD